MGKARKFNEASILPVLSDLEASGLTLRDFAAQRGLSAATLYRWRARMRVSRREKRRSRDTPRFLEVSVPPGASPAQDPGFYELVLQDPLSCRLRIPCGFEAQDLERLLSVVLKSC